MPASRIFTPFFFIGVGADFDITLLGSFGMLAFSLFLAFMVFISNIYPVLFSPFMKVSPREGLGMSLLLSAPLSMIVVSGALGVKMGLLSEELNGQLILTAVGSSILFPVAFRYVSRKFASASQVSGENA